MIRLILHLLLETKYLLRRDRRGEEGDAITIFTPFPYFTLLYYINTFMSDLFILNCVRSCNIFLSAFDLSGPPLNVQQAGQTKTLTRVNLTGTHKDQQ